MDSSLEVIDISTDKSKLDLDLLCRVIPKQYWALNRTASSVLRSIQNSMCFGFYVGGRQIGFARVITDFSTFAYLCDVFVLDSERGRGYGSRLLDYIFSHPELSSVKWVLRTKDAHSLYARFGFLQTHRPDRYMECLSRPQRKVARISF